MISSSILEQIVFNACRANLLIKQKQHHYNNCCCFINQKIYKYDLLAQRFQLLANTFQCQPQIVQPLASICLQHFIKYTFKWWYYLKKKRRRRRRSKRRRRIITHCSLLSWKDRPPSHSKWSRWECQPCPSQIVRRSFDIAWLPWLVGPCQCKCRTI